MENFNKNIHPYSIFYRNSPRFTELAEKYEYLAKYVSNDKMNFKSHRACRALCKAILQEFFSIRYWKIPKGYLIPSIPQRLNYLCWIKEITSNEQLTVLDIGTGANLIFPLLGTSSFNWDFIATEAHEPSFKIAEKIIRKNRLEHKIRLLLSFNSIISNITENFDVSICNPPFFEFERCRKDGFGGIEEELSTSGGELKFIKQYMVESWKLRKKVKIFTSLVGIKAHLEELERFLSKNFPNASMKTTTLYQGNTLRWVIAWNFQ